MEKLDQYFKLQTEIYDYFGYHEDWVVLPLDDARKYYWKIDQDDQGRGEVVFASSAERLFDETEEGNIYSNDIYTQRFLKKWVYRGEDFTMICVDTRTDGNKFLQIFDNKKELSDYGKFLQEFDNKKEIKE